MTRILVADDHDVVREGIRALLDAHQGWSVCGEATTGREAVDAPRSHHQWLPDRLDLEQGAVSDDVLAKLRALGHTVRQQGSQGAAHSIWVQPGTGAVFGVNDKRESVSKASAAKWSAGSLDPGVKR